jgi:hypothetical protein
MRLKFISESKLTRFCSENRSEARDINFLLHCWMKNELREVENKAWQRVWSTSAWRNKMKCRRFSLILSSSYYVDVCDNFCFELHEILHILRILLWWWTFDKRFFDVLILRINRFWKRKTLIFDVIISSIIVALLDFAVTKKSFARVNFVVSDEMSLNNCVDHFDEDEF